MAMQYADRAFISVNGAVLLDLMSSNLRINKNAKPVPSMTPTTFNTGYVAGNWDIDIDFTIGVEDALTTPLLELIDYSSNSMQINYIVGSDQYVCSKLFNKEAAYNTPGVGEVAKKDFKFGALGLSSSVSNSSLLNISGITS